jgi:hypothetical protein
MALSIPLSLEGTSFRNLRVLVCWGAGQILSQQCSATKSFAETGQAAQGSPPTINFYGFDESKNQIALNWTSGIGYQYYQRRWGKGVVMINWFPVGQYLAQESENDCAIPVFGEISGFSRGSNS